MPAILAELGFIDAKGEGEKLATEEWRQRAAEAIYQGILDYYEEMGNNVFPLINKRDCHWQSLLFINVSLYFRHMISFNFIYKRKVFE